MTKSDVIFDNKHKVLIYIINNQITNIQDYLDFGEEIKSNQKLYDTSKVILDHSKEIFNGHIFTENLLTKYFDQLFQPYSGMELAFFVGEENYLLKDWEDIRRNIGNSSSILFEVFKTFDESMVWLMKDKS